MDFDQHALEHFLNLARRGKFGWSSGGEKRARLIAETILENAPGLDQTALEGAAEFMRVTAIAYSTAKRLIE